MASKFEENMKEMKIILVSIQKTLESMNKSLIRINQKLTEEIKKSRNKDRLFMRLLIQDV